MDQVYLVLASALLIFKTTEGQEPRREIEHVVAALETEHETHL